MRFEVEMTDVRGRIKRLFEISATTNLRHVIDRWIGETEELQFKVKVTLA